jgi:hypothetical protein
MQARVPLRTEIVRRARMSAPKIPSNYTINSTTALSGGLDFDLDNIHIREIAPITLTSDSKVTTDSKLTSDSKIDLGLDNIRIREIPRIAINPTRVHFPVNLKFGLCTFGVELVAFSVCGESMIVIEDYVPHETEVCA